MKKISKIIIMLIVSFTALSGCGDKKNSNGVITLNVTTVSGPGDAHTQGLIVFKEKLKQYSNGKIKVNVFPSGALFSGEQDFPALLQGDVDIAYVSPQYFAEYIPTFSMFGTAYLFKNYHHMRTVFSGEIGKTLFQSITDKFHIVPLSVFYLGSRELNLTKDITLTSRSDLAGIKLRMPNTPTWLNMGRALGANPSPLSFSEVYLGLKTGTIDGQDNPLGTMKNAKFYEVAKTVILTNHMIDTLWPIMSEKAWAKLSKKQQEFTLKAMEDAREYVDNANLKRDSDLIKEFKADGVNVITLDSKVLESYKNEVQQYYLNDKEISKDWDLKMYEKIKNAK